MDRAERGDYLPIVQGVLNPLIPHGSTIALFDFPNHANVGDSLIWLGEEAYLKDRGDLRISVVDDLTVQYRRLPSLPDSTVILIQGGGNLGDLWIRHQSLREKIVTNYRGHRVIQLPQSIHFQDATNEEQCQRVFGAHNDFHLLVRDRDSLEHAKRLHTGPTQLCPDMALCLGPLPRTKEPRHAIVALLRTDIEAVKLEANWAGDGDLRVADWLEEPDFPARRIARALSTLQARYPNYLSGLYGIKRRLYHRLATERLERGRSILGSGQVVITDRLHAHLLCTLMGIPHVVLDNNYGKIAHFREAWSTGTGICEPASSKAEALVKARRLLLDQYSNRAA